MTALLAPFPKFVAEDDSGATLPGALLYTYAAGTTTPLATYTDSTGAVPNANPVVCDSAGRANVWLTAGAAYKFVLQNAQGVVQWTVDNITGGLQGTAGAPGSTWRSGAGVPSDATGNNGDYWLDTSTGDIYAKATGSYGLVMNIKGPPGSSVNVLKNGSFYQGLSPWNSLPSDPASGVTPTAPVIGAGHTAASSAAQLLCPSTDFAVAKILRGSISQGFSIPVPAGTNTLTFWTTAYLETVAAAVSNNGYIKAYLFSQTAGTETLVGTYNLTATSATPVWTQQSIDLTASLPAQGDYGVRFEIQSACNNVGGSGSNKGTIVAIDDITLLVTSAGVTGPTGPTGATGPAGPAGTATSLQKTTYTSNATYTTGPNTTWLDVTCTGGGGGGAGYGTTAGGGGGAGGTIKKRIAVTPSTGYAIVIGPAGGGGAIGASGTAGTDTTFGGTLVVGKGGGAGSATGAGGAGGAAGVYAGGAAGAAGGISEAPATVGGSTVSHVNVDILAAIPGGGGGGGAYPNTVEYYGKAGGATDAYAGGTAYAGIGVAGEAYGGGGGASAWGSGGKGANNAFGAGAKTNATSPAAGAYGAGGGGGCAYYGTGAGANGADGVCVVEEIRG